MFFRVLFDQASLEIGFLFIFFIIIKAINLSTLQSGVIKTVLLYKLYTDIPIDQDSGL